MPILSAVLILLARFICSPSRANFAPTAELVTPIWSANLSTAIGNSPVGVVGGGLGHEYVYEPKRSVWFTDDHTVVATFVTSERRDNPKLPLREPLDENLLLRLRPVFLDAESGKIRSTPDWPAGSRDASIVATHDGKFVTQTGGGLTLYSPELKELKKLRLPPTPTDLSQCCAHSSPTGKSILFIASNLRTTSAVPWIWVDTDSLDVVRSWEEVQSGAVGISDGVIAMTTCVWFYKCDPAVEIRGLNTTWTTVASASRQDKPQPQFVTGEFLYLLGNSTRLVRTDGTVIFNEDTHIGGCWSGGAVPSAGGQRFVVPSCKLKGRVEMLDLGGYIVLDKFLVYDSPFVGVSHVLNVKGPKFRDTMLFAISPNGSKLAVLNGESLYVFQLPPLK